MGKERGMEGREGEEGSEGRKWEWKGKGGGGEVRNKGGSKGGGRRVVTGRGEGFLEDVFSLSNVRSHTRCWNIING